MNNTIPSSGCLIRFLLAFAAVVCFSTTQGAYGQNLNTCQSYVLNTGLQADYQPLEATMSVCIFEWTPSNGTPQIEGYTQVESNNSAYLPFTDAEMVLQSMDTNNNYTFLGQSDWNNYTDEPEEPSLDTDAGITAAMTPGDVYDANAGYGYCYDPTGNYGWNPNDDAYDNCTWADYWANPTYDLGTNMFIPSAQVVSVLYSPPGDKSTTGYTSGTTNGTTTSIGSSFTQSYGIQFSAQGNIFGGFFGGSIGYSSSQQTGNTTSNQTTVTDAGGAVAEANTLPTYNPNNLDMPNRAWDSFVVLMNPEITTATDDSNNIVGYSQDMQPVQGDGWTVEPAGAEVIAEDMINGTVPVSALIPKPLPLLPGQPQYDLPGLASMCHNVIQAEYTSGTCTLGDQCGCQKGDFSPILVEDALLGWNPDPNVLAANPMPAYESPVNADTSGAACLNPNSSLSCRYVPIPQTTGNYSAIQTVPLTYGFQNPFTQSDTNSTNVVFSEQHSNTVTLTTYYGWSFGSKALGGQAKLTNTDSWTWTNTESQGQIHGTQNSLSINLQTGNPGCSEDNYVYEDTTYHTFVIQPPQNASGCLQ